MIIEGLDISRNAHSSIKIITQSKKVIYIDPFQIQDSEKADYIFITHEHYDHCSIADIRKIMKPETVIITVPDCQSKLAGMPVKGIQLVKPGDKFSTPYFEVIVVPAYNLNKHFHAKEHQWVGFILRIDEKTLYHMGDSDVIPEMKSLVNLNIILVPVSGHFTMNAKEAAQLINFLKPKVAIPIHYGAGVVGTQHDAEEFKSLVKDSNVIIL
ncbi:MAG: MBL fold metallo-hydrolase [Nanoarchaeota archaeon]